MVVPRWVAGPVGTLLRLTACMRIRSCLAALTLSAVQAWRQRRHAARVAELARRDKAVQRSRDLLRACLGAEQLDQFDRAGWFIVSGRVHDYRIKHGRTANIELIARDGRYRGRLCFYPEAGRGRELPVYDVMLAQKLVLEGDELAALAIAVAHP